MATNDRKVRRLQGKNDALQKRCDAYENLYNNERFHVELLRQALIEYLPVGQRDGEGIRKAIEHICKPLPKGFILMPDGRVVDEQQAIDGGTHPGFRDPDEPPVLRVIDGKRGE